MRREVLDIGIETMIILQQPLGLGGGKGRRRSGGGGRGVNGGEGE